MYGSTKFSEESECELIKLAGFLNSEELEAVEIYLKSLQNDVNDAVIKRIVDFSKAYKLKKTAQEKAAF
jgi:hypothetical protein